MTTGNTQIPSSRQPAKSPRASQRAHRWLAGGILAVLALAVIAGALLHAPTPAEAQSAVLISNTSQTAHSTGETLNSTTAKLAQAFTLSATASADGYTVTSIGIAFHTIGDTSTIGADLTVTLNASSSGSPGNVLCTLSNPSTFAASGVHAFDAPTTGTTCPLLTQNKTYFAVIERANGNTDAISLNTTGSTNEDSGGATGWSIANNRHWYTTAWGSTSGESHQIEITGHEGPPNNSATGEPTISGTPRVNETLTADTSGINDDDGLTNQNFSYKWFRFDGTDETEITGATGSTYDLTVDDVGQRIRVKVSFNDDLGNAEGPLSSLPTDAVAPSNLLVSNTGQTPNSSLFLNNILPRHAQGFTTGLNEDGYTVDSIGFTPTLSDTATAGIDLQVTLNEKNNSNQPGDTLCTLTDPATFTTGAVNEFDAPGTCPNLTKETTYFVVIERVSISGTSTISTSKTDSAAEDTSSTANWSIADVGFAGSTTTWGQGFIAGEAFQIEVYGKAVPTTAPPTATLETTSDLIPSDLAGDRFRLIFLTHSGQGVTSADIATYNTYVQSQANASSALAGIKTHSSSFRVLGSTEAVDARDNTGTTHTDDQPGVPIYWLNGSKVADDYADLYDGTWDDEANPTRRDGNTVSPGQVWTGSNNDGTENRNASPDRTKGLGGNPVVRIGHLNNSTAGNDPLHAAASLSRALTTLPFYALSPVFVVPPRVNSVALTSDPNDDSRTGDDDTYAIDDTLQATVSFNTAADITGSPELTLLFGTAEKTASCAAATNTTTMVCSYTVILNDTAPLGVGIKQDSLTLNGGTITETGTTTNADLAHDAVGLQSGHKVDAIRPTLVTTGSNAPRTSTNGSKIILTFSESVRALNLSKIALLIAGTTTTVDTNDGRVNGTTVELDLIGDVFVTSPPLTVELAADAVEDTAGNGNLGIL